MNNNKEPMNRLDEISALQFGYLFSDLDKKEQAMALELLDGGINNYEMWRQIRYEQTPEFMWQMKQ